MNIIVHRKYLIEFDVWEPFKSKVNEEMDKVVAHAKNTLGHAGSVKITPLNEERI